MKKYKNINRFPVDYEIIKINKTSTDIFLIKKGVVTITSEYSIHKYVDLFPGSYFGDYLILFNLLSSNSFR